MKLLMPVDGRELFLTQLNSFLPSDIRAHLLTKVTGGFNAKTACSGRRYNYLLPTYMLHDASKITSLFETKGITDSNAASLEEHALHSVREQLVQSRVEPVRLELLRAALKLFEGQLRLDPHGYVVFKFK